MGVKAKKARDTRSNSNTDKEDSSDGDSESEEGEVSEIEPIVDDEKDEKDLLSFMEENELRKCSPTYKKPRLDSIHSQLGEWGSSMQLLLDAKKYSVNFVLFQPDNSPRFIPFFADRNSETDAIDLRVGWIRYRNHHFDVVKFEMKQVY